MATVNFFKSFDMSNPPSIWTGTVTNATNSYIRILEINLSGDDYEGEYFGRNFKYSNTDIVSGTLTAYNNSTNDTLDYSITGLNLNVKTVKNFIRSNDFFGISNLALNGNDTINGSSFSDTLLGFKGNDLLVGNGGNDYLYGNQGKDFLYGMDGNDILVGGKGKDAFVFQNINEGIDTIYDFSSKNDKIWFSKLGFIAFATNPIGVSISSNQFLSSSSATSAFDFDDRIIYNSVSGALYYDSDGLGGHEAVQIAIVGTSLKFSDIYIF